MENPEFICALIRILEMSDLDLIFDKFVDVFEQIMSFADSSNLIEQLSNNSGVTVKETEKQSINFLINAILHLIAQEKKF